jgi:hypothetical protein
MIVCDVEKRNSDLQKTYGLRCKCRQPPHNPCKRIRFRSAPMCEKEQCDRTGAKVPSSPPVYRSGSDHVCPHSSGSDKVAPAGEVVNIQGDSRPRYESEIPLAEIWLNVDRTPHFLVSDDLVRLHRQRTSVRLQSAPSWRRSPIAPKVGSHAR